MRSLIPMPPDACEGIGSQSVPWLAEVPSDNRYRRLTRTQTKAESEDTELSFLDVISPLHHHLLNTQFPRLGGTTGKIKTRSSVLSLVIHLQ